MSGLVNGRVAPAVDPEFRTVVARDLNLIGRGLKKKFPKGKQTLPAEDHYGGIDQRLQSAARMAATGFEPQRRRSIKEG